MSACAHRKLPAIVLLLAMTDQGQCAESSMRGAASAPANSSVTAAADPAKSSATAASAPANSSLTATRVRRRSNVMMEYFTFNVDCVVPDLAGRTPQRVLHIPDVYIPLTSDYNPTVHGIQTGTNWAARFSSLLEISQGGRYTFQINKHWSDSAMLTVDGYQVIASNCRDNSPTGIMSLTAGYHEVVLTYADDGWQDMLVLSYTGPDTRDWFEVVPAHRFAADQWVLGAEGQPCSTVCQSIGKVCNHRALQSGVTAAEVAALGTLVSYTCANTIGWAYDSNPGICTNPRCCLTGSCTGWCAHGDTGARSCAATSGHYSRLCPCT